MQHISSTSKEIVAVKPLSSSLLALFCHSLMAMIPSPDDKSSGLSQKDREERLRQLRDRQQLEKQQKLEELKEHVSDDDFSHHICSESISNNFSHFPVFFILFE